MSLTKDEIIEFTGDYLDGDYQYRGDDDFVMFAWTEFLKSHGLNPLLSHHFVFNTDDEFMIESLEYDVRWMPNASLGAKSFEYKSIHISIEKVNGKSNITRGHKFIPNLGYGLIK